VFAIQFIILYGARPPWGRQCMLKKEKQAIYEWVAGLNDEQLKKEWRYSGTAKNWKILFRREWTIGKPLQKAWYYCLGRICREKL